mmetsp:Transcript_45549/g.138427  ORF Transcript_45549/g.138427 Transcript_45549/m.138427 type:complete len:169 (+) Transcript_45549:72-578(+)
MSSISETAGAKQQRASNSDAKQRCGSCYCGKVDVKVTGKPISVSICHCTICQRLNGAPFGIQSLHRAQNISINRDPDDLWSIQTSKHVVRYRCKDCGSPVFATLGRGKTYAVPRTILFQDKYKPGEDVDYRPTHHMYYASRIIDVDDEIPKYIGTSRPGCGVLWDGNG